MPIILDETTSTHDCAINSAFADISFDELDVGGSVENNELLTIERGRPSLIADKTSSVETEPSGKTIKCPLLRFVHSAMSLHNQLSGMCIHVEARIQSS